MLVGQSGCIGLDIALAATDGFHALLYPVEHSWHDFVPERTGWDGIAWNTYRIHKRLE